MGWGGAGFAGSYDVVRGATTEETLPPVKLSYLFKEPPLLPKSETTLLKVHMHEISPPRFFFINQVFIVQIARRFFVFKFFVEFD